MTEHARQDEALVRDWWAANPMTYGSEHGTTEYKRPDGTVEVLARGTRQFFDAVDQTFMKWNEPLHVEAVPFARIFPYAAYRDRPVLEIGCGMGTMAMQWARHGAKVTAVDLNPVAVQQTRERFRVHRLSGSIVQADSRVLPFADDSFDYLYSWGVLHHSPDLERSLEQCFRVLRPGGRYGVMLYNRASIFFKYRVAFVEGYLHGESRFLGPLELASRYGDGLRDEGNPHTWPITPDEALQFFGKYSSEMSVKCLGTDVGNSLPQLVPLPKIKRWLPTALKKPWARRWGWSLWIAGIKR